MCCKCRQALDSAGRAPRIAGMKTLPFILVSSLLMTSCCLFDKTKDVVPAVPADLSKAAADVQVPSSLDVSGIQPLLPVIVLGAIAVFGVVLAMKYIKKAKGEQPKE